MESMVRSRPATDCLPAPGDLCFQLLILLGGQIGKFRIMLRLRLGVFLPSVFAGPIDALENCIPKCAHTAQDRVAEEIRYGPTSQTAASYVRPGLDALGVQPVGDRLVLITSQKTVFHLTDYRRAFR